MEAIRDRVAIQRKNLALVCSLSVKTLIDKSCYMTLDEQSAEFCNFCIILEHVFNHQFKPRVTWYRGKDLKGVWDYIKQACKTVPNNCIANLANFEHIKTGHGKVRAWIRVSLMEKRLSEYISAAMSQIQLTRQFYGDDALLLSEEADLLTKSLLGLNAIDFSFDLKSGDLDVPGCTVIDYSPYLNFTQCPQSVFEDLRELRSLSITSRDEFSDAPPGIASGSSSSADLHELERGSPDGKGPDTPQHTPATVNGQSMADDTACSLDQYRTLVQQKGYLEELLRLRESQLHTSRQDRKVLQTRLGLVEGDKFREIHQMETVVIELQAQLQTLKNDYHRLQRHVIMTSQGRKSSVPRFRYSARDQRLHSFSSDTSELQHQQIPTADEASTLLPDSPGADLPPNNLSLAQELLNCDLEVPPPPTILSSSAESNSHSHPPVTMNVEAEIHNSYESDHDHFPPVQGSPIADLLAGQKTYYNLGADVDRESSEERNTRGSSEERQEDATPGVKTANETEPENLNSVKNEETSEIMEDLRNDNLQDVMNGNNNGELNSTLTDDNQTTQIDDNRNPETDENYNDQISNKGSTASSNKSEIDNALDKEVSAP